MEQERIDLLGVHIHNITMEETLQRVSTFFEESVCHCVYTPNLEILEACVRNPEDAGVINSASLVIPDGAGVILAANILGTPLKEKVSGVDLCINLLVGEAGSDRTLYLLGGKPGVAELASQNISRDYPDVRVVGYHDGYFDAEEEHRIIEEINMLSPDLLFVALGAPKQERWLHANRSRLNTRVAIGCGGAIDIIAGTVTLTPEFFRRHGLEWLHRLCRQPSRFKRMLAIPSFLLRVIWKRMNG